MTRNEINDLLIKLGHPLEDIIWAMGKAIGLQLTCIFKSCKDRALGDAKKMGVSKMAVAHSTVKGERLFIYISSPFTASMGGKITD